MVFSEIGGENMEWIEIQLTGYKNALEDLKKSNASDKTKEILASLIREKINDLEKMLARIKEGMATVEGRLADIEKLSSKQNVK